MYFSTANPCMKYSGVIGESKYKVLQAIPYQFRPKTIFIPSSTPYHSILKQINNNKFKYPFIIKPDVGERGKDVEMIKDENELKTYLVGKSFHLNIQEFINLDLEFGVMYHRMPTDQMGKITSVVQKGFLFVTGNGTSSLHDLMKAEIRISGRITYLEKKYKTDLNLVLPKGEKKYLEPIGNHCRGTTFYNANHIINDSLKEIINDISVQIDGFYYGRFDLKVNTLDDLYEGRNMEIIELNGVSSEVAHIYDPEYNLIQAYKDVFSHMKYIYEIAKQNHESGYEYDSLWQFIKDLRTHLKG